MDSIMVSICCLAYNHEKYIADALNGFLMQKTNFPFEVVIHDDASTDSTTQIIREYAQKHPDIIRPIYQTENQYSKQIKVLATYLYPNARGKYIALCEGDDYWTDPLKLQKQVDYMQSNPDCTLCFTNGRCEKNGVLSDRIVPWVQWNRKAYQPGDADYDMGQMVLLDYVPTASLLFHRNNILSMPAFSPNSFTGDTCVRLYLTSLGYAHCIDEDTCVYRFGLEGSSTTQWAQNNKKALAFLQKMDSLLQDIDRMTANRYAPQIQELRLRLEYKRFMALGDLASVRQKKFHRLYRSDGAAAYGKYLLNVYCPGLFHGLRSLKKKITGK